MNNEKNSNENVKCFGFAVGFTLGAVAAGMLLGWVVKKAEGR